MRRKGDVTMILDLAKEALASPIAFKTFQSLFGAPRCHKRFIREMVRPLHGERIFDVGCGAGASMPYLPESVEYVGIDISAAYVAKAKADFGSRGRFICADVTTLDSALLGTFDRAFAFGVLHHLSNEMAAQMVGFVRRVMRPGGCFVTIDPCRVPAQHPVAKFLIDNDRGKYIRTEEEFARLVSTLGPVRTEIHQDLLRIPYTQVVMWVEIRPQDQITSQSGLGEA